jgi:hypothetical protein
MDAKNYSALRNFEWRAVEKLVTQTAERSGARVRVISPTSVITRDVNENRLNVRLDDGGVVRGFDVG